MPIETSRSFEFSEDQVKEYNRKPSNDTEEVRRLKESGFFAHSKEILDIGCGDGKFSAILAAHLPHTSITGCDVSNRMIEYALKHYAAPNLNFVEKSAENLDFILNE